MELLELLGRPAGGAEQPAGDGDPVQRASQRGQPLGRTDPALGAGGLDRGAAGLGTGRDPNDVPGGAHIARERPAACAAADQEDPSHRVRS